MAVNSWHSQIDEFTLKKYYMYEMAEISEIESFNQTWATNLIDVFEWACLFFCKYYTMTLMLRGLAHVNGTHRHANKITTPY